MGFQAVEAVEVLTYDFRPYVDKHGTIPEPSSDQIEAFRDTVFGGLKASGLDPENLKVSLANMDELLSKSSELEALSLHAVADLVQIDAAVLDGLPHRIKTAFVGWIMGQFFNPEA